MTPTPWVSLASQDGNYSLVADARNGGASDAQIALLVAADLTTSMSFATAKDAIEASFACFDDAGIPHSSVSSGAGGDPTYSFGAIPGVSDEESLAIADECLRQDSFWVEMYYETQPAAVQEEERLLALARPIIVTCLEDEGVAVDDELPIDDLIRFAHQPENIANRDCVLEAFRTVGLN